uniref:C2H2-type domain-containing protein n=1 Tax=viral metagenome TaxID=1070528 RepID=A0A6C0D6S1_9ZZZZ
MTSKYIKNENGHFICPNCEVVKKNQNTMYYHMKKHEGKLPFECDICQKDFLQKSSLELHKLSKHSTTKKETKMFQCVFDNCDFKSITKSNRRIHCLRKHFKEEIDKIMDENNSCNSCNKTFQSSTAFYYHVIDCIKVDTVEKQKFLTLID